MMWPNYMTRWEKIEIVKETYHNVADVQIRNRGLSLTHDECLKDSIEACKLILTEGKMGGTLIEYSILKKGKLKLNPLIKESAMFSYKMEFNSLSVVYWPQKRSIFLVSTVDVWIVIGKLFTILKTLFFDLFIKRGQKNKYL